MWAGEAYGTAIRTAALPMVNLKGDQTVKKHRILVQKSWDSHQRNDFSEPKLLHFSIHRKVLNSLTWNIWVHLISSNLDVQTTCPLLQNFYIIWFFPFAPWSSFLRATWDVVSWTWNPKNSHWIKYRLWLFFKLTLPGPKISHDLYSLVTPTSHNSIPAQSLCNLIFSFHGECFTVWCLWFMSLHYSIFYLKFPLRGIFWLPHLN